MNSSQFTGSLFALCSSFTWAIGVSAYSSLSQRFSGSIIHCTRALVALPFFLLVTWITGSDFSQIHISQVEWYTVSVICSYALGDVILLQSAQSMGVSGALSIASSYPLWSALAGWLFKGEALSAWKMIGLISVVTGTTFVILSGYRQKRVSSRGGSYMRGVLLAVLTSLLWALNSFSLSVGGTGVSTAAGNAVRMVLALVLCPFFGILLTRKVSFFIPMRDLSRFSWVFALESFGGSYFFMYGLSHAPLAIAATLSSLTPVISAPIAWVLGRERFSLFQLSGILLAVAGVGLLFL